MWLLIDAARKVAASTALGGWVGAVVERTAVGHNHMETEPMVAEAVAVHELSTLRKTPRLKPRMTNLGFADLKPSAKMDAHLPAPAHGHLIDVVAAVAALVASVVVE